MKKGTHHLAAILALLTLLLWTSCNGCGDNSKPIEIDPAFSQYISAFTSGVVSRASVVTIRLADDMPNVTAGNPLERGLLNFSPSIEGEAYWADARTIEFRPASYLPSGETYKGELALAKLKEVPEKLSVFEFQFQTIAMYMDVSFGEVETYPGKQLEWLMLKGSIRTADVVDGELVQQMLKAKQDGKDLNIRWTMDANNKNFRFEVDSVHRGENKSLVNLTWDGDAANIEEKGEKEISIPSIKDFVLMHFDVVKEPEQYISLQFSDPLMEDQDLEGLLTIAGVSNLNYTIVANEVKIYPSSRLTGTRMLKISPGIKNLLGYKLNDTRSIELEFKGVMPEVKLSGNGVILPNSNGLLFPFQAISLSAVEVTIVKIYSHNVGQFMQANELSGTRELKRVGRPILKKTVPLTGDGLDRSKWGTYYVDLADLIKTEPGAIYNVEIGFRREHSLYGCADDTVASKLTSTATVDEELEVDGSWDKPANYYYYDDDYYYYDDYNWRERDDPCTNSYYGRRRSVNRNLLASDIGIIAKGGDNKKLLFAITNMLTTEPMADVSVKVYNFQNDLLVSTKTDGIGMVNVELDAKPFLLVAEKNGEFGYLRLDDGSALSLSQFDVSGERVQKGIKGYIYGERGVWRPGDSLYVTFMLEDEEKTLPAEHPVIFELKDPRGQLVQKRVITGGLNGVYDMRTATDAEAPTGNWRATVRVGGTVFSKYLKIETVKPNRLKIDLDLGKDKIASTDTDVKAKLTVKWLHGAIARNLKTKVVATMSPMNTTFEKYSNYEFDDPSRGFTASEEQIFDGKLNEEGTAMVPMKIKKAEDAPGMLKANLVIRAFEESGDFSIDRVSIPYAPFSSFVGIQTPEGDHRSMIVTDTNHVVRIVTVDADGKPIDREGLQVSVYKVSWRWWWESGQGDLYSYSGSTYNNLVKSGKVNTINGKGEYKLRVNHPEWGRYLIRVCDPVSGHCTGKTVYMDWPGWVGRQRKDGPGGAAMLMFTSDKSDYVVGETAQVTIPTSGVGRALVTVESGSKVISAQWVEAQDKETRVSIPVTEAMAPNVFVAVTLVQPHAQTANDLPIRMYGVVPISVTDPSTKLAPKIDMPDVLRPEQPVTIKVSEGGGQAMTYTVAVVDDGLLDLTRFKTPDPWSAFYAREALGVKTWDIYNDVMGAFAGKIKALLSIGGDEEMGKKQDPSAQRFKPVVKFLGPFELKAGETKEHTFTMPNYVGSVRTMVVAADNGAYGSTDKTTPVRKPLMVLATLPRVLGPTEQVKLPVTVFAMEDHVKDVDVEVKVSGPVKLTGASTQKVSFTKTGDKVVNFDLEVLADVGVAKVQVITTSGKEKATTEIELNVRNPNPPVVEFTDVTVKPGESWNYDYTPIGIKGTNTGVLEIANMPPIDLGRRLRYLISYPHGCIEQTTSAVFPQLFLEHVTKLTDSEKHRSSDNIRSGLNRLRLFQRSDGGFGYWPNSSNTSVWGTNYAGHFMIMAEKAGYTLPIGLKANWLRYQSQAARNWTVGSVNNDYEAYGRVMDQAYRLYTLALAGEPELGAMNRLREHKDLTVEAKYRLAAAYALAGKKDVANELVSSLDVVLPSRPYNYYSYNYGSAIRDKAMILETLTLLSDDTNAFKLLKEISDKLNDQYWMSTQTTAYALMAAAQYAKVYAPSGAMTYSYSLNGSASEKVTSALPVSQVDLGIKGAEPGKISMKNESNGVLYVKVMLEGVPATGDPVSKSENLTMDVNYTDMQGNSIDVSKLEQGTDFMAVVTVRNPSSSLTYRNMALSQIFPSGWEIHNTRMDNGPSAHKQDVPTYQDIRDDRVYTYFDVYKTKHKVYKIQLNATYLGKFYLPTVYCEAMYDNTIYSRKAGQWVEVVKAGQ